LSYDAYRNVSINVTSDILTEIPISARGVLQKFSNFFKLPQTPDSRRFPNLSFPLF